ncbi:unannotated protein [freshwater metagenome]|uniref:Unannotated protein n=1 Tax=freshwater metagenome TaxID=449393 RepID=A0A6J7RK32_9ZZZZ
MNQTYLWVESTESAPNMPVRIIMMSAPMMPATRPSRSRVCSPPPVSGFSPTVTRPISSNGVVTIQSM